MLKNDNVISKKYDYRKFIKYSPQPFEIMLAKQLISFRKKGGHLVN